MSDIRLHNYIDYKKFINEWILSLSKNGRGKYLEIATELNAHTTLVSQIFKGNRDLSMEQAFQICDYLGMNKVETDYFMLLVQKEKAGNHNLQRYYSEKIKEQQIELQDMKSRIKTKKTLSETDKALFYSNWFYSAIRLSTSVEGINTRDDIADFLDLPHKLVNQVVDFLVSVSLLFEDKGKLEFGPAITHLESKSPLIARHHANWRVKAMERHPKLSTDEFCFSGPLTIAEQDASKVRKKLTKVIEEVSEIVRKSEKVDKVYCINIDWFKPIN
jgi:uncharacterized protein (TIGR02147 family)